MKMCSSTYLLAVLFYTSFVVVDRDVNEGDHNSTSLLKTCYYCANELQLQHQQQTTSTSILDYYISHQKYMNYYICTAWIMETIYLFSVWILTRKLLNNETHKEDCLSIKSEEDVDEQYYVKSGKCDDQKLNNSDERSVSELALFCSELNRSWWKPPKTHLMVYTVPRYPDNHNPLLPLTLQQQLDEMNPREYLTYVLKELTLEERESLMVDEKQRRKTFLVNWPYENQPSGICMAQAGFYSLDDYDRVQCVFCRGSLHNWDSGETPLTEHARSFNFCRFIKGLECGNREYRSNMLSEDDVRNITRFQSTSTSDRQRRTKAESIDSGILGISTNRAAMIRYAPDATRIRTFARWPATCPITAQRMCDAGFYYTGFDDQVRCFHCSGGIKQWSDNDDPWEEHARWFPDCPFVIQQKGQAYVDEAHDKTPANKKCVRKTQSQKKAEIKQVEHRHTQQDMRSICFRLGHSPDVINRTLVKHGKPFDRINSMVEALYDTELNGEDSSDDAYADQTSHTSVISSQPLACPEEDSHRLRDQRAENITPGRFDGSENRPRHNLGCRRCEMTTEGFVPATHIGLPCGHLIFCDSCNGEEKRKSANSTYSVKCPFYNCGTTLTGTIKVYFA